MSSTSQSHVVVPGEAINMRMSIAWGETIIAVSRLGHLRSLATGLLLLALGSFFDILPEVRSSALRLPLGHLVSLPTRLPALYGNDYPDSGAVRCEKPSRTAMRLERLV